jgi:hypothetical protein
MAETLAEKLSKTALKAAMLQSVVSEDLDHIPPDLDDLARFVICAVRAVARRGDAVGLSIFVYSEAPLAEGKPHGFSRVMHMQDGRGVVSNMTILASRDANNGAARAHATNTIEAAVEELAVWPLDIRTTVIWDGAVRTATVYPEGTVKEQIFCRFVIPAPSDNELTQDDVCEVLNVAYNDNLKNPSGHTAKLWTKGKLVSTAEDEIERHLRGQIALFFAGRARPVRVLPQTNTAAGRADLNLSSKGPSRWAAPERRTRVESPPRTFCLRQESDDRGLEPRLQLPRGA